MTVNEIMTELESLGSPQIKKILLNHGVKEPLFGVKVEQLKTIVKRIKKDYVLSKQLYDTGNADAMYLAGLIADDLQMTEKDLNHWVGQATSANISEYIVPWVAAGGNFGFKLGLQWIESEKEYIAAAGWSTLSQCLAFFKDDHLDLTKIELLLKRIEYEIHSNPNRIGYTMNGFIISVGSYVKPLYALAVETAQKVGKVDVLMDGTACKVPSAVDYINKVQAKGQIGRKKKVLKC